ncbi:MAG: hypothetical protein NVS3B21_03150 [Acidimicrobiales bacterium]
MANVIAALVEVAEVDVLSISDRHGHDPDEVPTPRGVARCRWVPRPPLNRTKRSLLRWVTSRLPRELAFRSWKPVRAEIQGWMRPNYSLVWFTACESYLGLETLVHSPTVVDLDDLESWKLRHRRSVQVNTPHCGKVVRPTASALANRLDERRWNRVEHAVAKHADRVLVCSELDRNRLNEPNTVVLPNGYSRTPPPHTDGRLAQDRPGTLAPTLLFIGLLFYPPNVDAATLLAREVLPAVRKRLPGAQLRLVGEPADEVAALGAYPGVTVAGRVPEVDPELAGADVVVVPVRYGGGTRIKIIEAFAHGVPVVSTSVGCEGLEVEAGRHLLVADTMAEFADAVVSIVQNDGLRRELVTNAAELWDLKYRWERIRPIVAHIVDEASAGGAT